MSKKIKLFPTPQKEDCEFDTIQAISRLLLNGIKNEDCDCISIGIQMFLNLVANSK